VLVLVLIVARLNITRLNKRDITADGYSTTNLDAGRFALLCVILAADVLRALARRYWR